MSDAVASVKVRPAVVKRQTAHSETNAPEKVGVPSSNPLARDSLGTKPNCVSTFSAGRLKPYPAATGMAGHSAGVFGRRVLANGYEH